MLLNYKGLYFIYKERKYIVLNIISKINNGNIFQIMTITDWLFKKLLHTPITIILRIQRHLVLRSIIHCGIMFINWYWFFIKCKFSSILVQNATFHRCVNAHIQRKKKFVAESVFFCRTRKAEKMLAMLVKMDNNVFECSSLKIKL